MEDSGTGDKMKSVFNVFLSFVFMLIISEFIARILFSPFFVDEKEIKKFRAPISYKSGGMRIAMLGDSFTYGSKVKDDETSSFLLQKLLIERLKRDDVFVDNFGISGTSTIEQFLIYKDNIKGKKYDFVILNFFIDDLTPYYYSNTLLNEYEYCRDLLNIREKIVSYMFYFRTFEFLYVYSDILLTYLEAGTPLTPVSYMIAKMRNKDSLRFRCALNRLINLGEDIKAEGAIPIFMLIPSLTLYDSQNPYPEEIAGYETDLMLLAQRSGFYVIDLPAELREVLDQRYIIKGDIHYNADGYRLISEILADKIMEVSGERSANR